MPNNDNSSSSQQIPAWVQVGGTGFEPVASTMPTLLRKVEKGILSDFEQFLRVNRRLEKITVLYTVEDVRRLLEKSDYVISYESISTYLRGYLDKAPKTYNKQITGLRRFVRDFLRLPKLITSFKMALVDTCQFYEDLPSKPQVKEGFNGLENVMAKTIYLFTATTGLRKSEILSLTKSQVDFESRAVIPNHFTRKKRSGITFYNTETEE
jgi:integrase